MEAAASQNRVLAVTPARLDLSAIAPLLARVETLAMIAASETIEPFLDEAARDATALLRSSCCLISRLVGNTLVDAGSYGSASYPIASGYGYLLDDYPSTKQVLETRRFAIASLDDMHTDPTEAFVLRKLGLTSVLMLPLSLGVVPWGLVEVYRADRAPFCEQDAVLGLLFASHLSGLIGQAEAREHVRRIYRETLSSLANSLELKDAVTHAHAEDVVTLALMIGQRLELGRSELETLELGALLHDVGKIRVPDSILNKPGPLTPEEWEVMRQHPAAGEAILAPIRSLHGVLPIVRHHHERWDGGGYPDRLAADEIPLGARIVSVCDAFSAMSQNRPYRRKRTRTETLHELRANAGTQLDPGCVDQLLAAVRERDVKKPPVPLQRPLSAIGPHQR
jgi:hypothetical protein